ncbi:MAG: aminotransferase class I/II-fold pyridoxal phosphate-dependent enzyme [Alphaproteobacteria bacterium]
MDVLTAANAKGAEGYDIVHMEVGEPGGGPPKRVIEAAKRTLGHRPLGYTEALGKPALRRMIADHSRRAYDIPVDPARVAVTVGASGAFLLSFLAAFDVGDRVVVPEPAFPAYRNMLKALDVEVVPLALGPETDFKPTAAMLDAIKGPIHGLVIASPSNPTGTMLSAGELAGLADYCAANAIRLISDEIYHGITYGREARSMLEYAPDAIVINGFSKYFCMTGWRLGWVIMPDDLVRPIERLAQNLFISAPALSQEAALTAFDCSNELDLRLDIYKQNREALLSRLPEAGLEHFAPADGAFYLYADVSHLTDDSKTFCDRILDEALVALAPGADFDSASGHRYIRLAFPGSHDRVVKGADRLAAWLKKQG